MPQVDTVKFRQALFFQEQTAVSAVTSMRGDVKDMYDVIVAFGVVGVTGVNFRIVEMV